MEEKKKEEIEKEKKREEILKEAKSFEKSPWTFFIRKSKLTYLIIFFLLIFGLFTIESLPRELQPEVKIPIAVVATGYLGASPLDVEQQVTKKIENEVFNLEGIKKINSTSSLGVSSVVVEFDADQDLTESIRKLKDEVQGVESDLPEDATTPQVIEISFSDQPIFIATLSSDRYDVADLKKIAEDLEDELKGVSYVSDVKVVGGRNRVVNVDINQELLAQNNLSLNQVIASISASNVNFPIGSIDFVNSKYSLRVEGEFETADELAKLPIAFIGDGPVLLEDVAKVEDGFSKEVSKSRLSINQDTPKEAVSVQVFKKTGGDITKVAEEVEKKVGDGAGVIYPIDVGVEITANDADYIKESIDTLTKNGSQTVMIILVLLFIFLGWREALIAGLAVPFSFFISFIIMAIVGESLNFLSLFALILALGLLVDSAIVVVEGMYRKVGEYKISGYDSAILTIKEYAAPLLSGMLTTVAVFFPLMFISGIMGEFLKVIPIVVNATLIAALFVALTIIPTIGALVLKPKTKKKEDQKSDEGDEQGFIKRRYGKIKKACGSKPREERWATRIFNKISDRYYNFIPKIIGSKKKRRAVIGGVIVLFFLSLTLPFSGILKVESFGEVDSKYFYVEVKLPEGTLLEKTDEVTKKAEEVILEETEVVNFVSSVGSGTGSDITSGDSSQTNVASIKVNLTKKENREIESGEIIGEIRSRLEKEITEAEISFIEEESGPPGGAPIELRVIGDDLETLEKIAEEIKNKLATISTVVEADTSVEFSAGEFVFIPNKDILAREGLTVAQVSQELRNGISGNDKSEITKDGEEIKIYIQYDEDQISSFSDIESILFVTPTGNSLALSELGEVKISSSLASINRKDKERIVTITADTEGGNPTEITTQLQTDLENFDLPGGYRLDYGGEQEETADTFKDMFMKMIIGIILILFILVIQFNSYRQVSIILFTIPLAMIGVFIGLAAARLTLDIPAFIGIVSLAGIVVNNAIIFVDQINKEIAKKTELVESVRTAGRSRLRPILLTSITTIFGLLPLSLTQPDWRNMGFAIIFGLAFSTLLTLFVLPTMFVSFYRKKLK